MNAHGSELDRQEELVSTSVQTTQQRQRPKLPERVRKINHLQNPKNLWAWVKHNKDLKQKTRQRAQTCMEDSGITTAATATVTEQLNDDETSCAASDRSADDYMEFLMGFNLMQEEDDSSEEESSAHDDSVESGALPKFVVVKHELCRSISVLYEY